MKAEEDGWIIQFVTRRPIQILSMDYEGTYTQMLYRVKLLRYELSMNLRKKPGVLVWRPRIKGQWLDLPSIEVYEGG